MMMIRSSKNFLKRHLSYTPIGSLNINAIASTAEVDEAMKRMTVAQQRFAEFSQDDVDIVFERVSRAIKKNSLELARYAVEESGIGLVEDKTLKNLYAAEYSLSHFKNLKTVGTIERDPINGVYKVAEPVGPICAITPCTNPTATVIIKALSALKTRNCIMFLPHPRTKLSSAYTANLMQRYAIEAGAPPDSIMCAMPSHEMSKYIMTHQETKFILATGGPAMVEACYSAGKPAIGVGSGNAPVLVDESYDLQEAINSVVIGKTFDWGTICASEQSLIVMESVYENAKYLLTKRGVHIVPNNDKAKLASVFMSDGKSVNPDIVGKSPHVIAKMAGISIPPETVALCVEASEIGDTEVFSHEKLSPILALYKAKNFHDGVDIAKRLAEHGGLGHTSCIYSNKNNRIAYFKDKVPTYHVAVNMPSSLGVIGIKYNLGVEPTMTVGVGSKGGSMASTNVGPRHLIHMKVVNQKRNIPEVFKSPFIYSNTYCLRSALENITAQLKTKNALIVSSNIHVSVIDEMRDLGFTGHHVSDIDEGVYAVKERKPSIIIAVGGSDDINIAKLIRIKAENPDISISELATPFLESRWRNTDAKINQTIPLLAIPTRYSMGAEMTNFAITESGHSIFLDALQPDYVIHDSYLLDPNGKREISSSGFHSFVQAIESFTSTNATTKTKLLVGEQAKTLFHCIGTDMDTECIFKASGDVGICVGNTSLGLASAMAAAFNAHFQVPVETASSLFITHVMKYNASDKPVRTTASPNIRFPDTSGDYASLATLIGFPGTTDKEKVQLFIDGINGLRENTGLPIRVKDLNIISDSEYNAAVDTMAEHVFSNQITSTNPRMPLLSEIKELFIAAY